MAWRATLIGGLAWSVALVAICPVGPAARIPRALAEVPVEGPVFSDPLEITNDFFPVVPGAVKVYIGRDGGERVTVVETHLFETREFEWGGQTVPCRIVREFKFESGALLEKERRYFAQADDGTVYSFGETEEQDEEDDEDEDEDGSGWIVGQRAETDPADVLTGASPTVIMPASPQVGDVWSIEDLPPFLHTSILVQRVGQIVRVPAGRFAGCLRVRETNMLDGEAERTWYAPGTGPVRSSGKGEHWRLQASSIGPG